MATQEQLQMPFQGGKSSIDRIQRNTRKRLMYFRKYSDTTMEWLRGEGDIRDEAEGRQRLKELRGNICHELSSASEETTSCVQDEVTVEEVEEWIPSAAAVHLE